MFLMAWGSRANPATASGRRWPIPGVSGRAPLFAGPPGPRSAWNAGRLHALVYWGESPHIAALTLVPLALLCVHLALRGRRPIWCLAAALSMAAVGSDQLLRDRHPGHRRPVVGVHAKTASRSSRTWEWSRRLGLLGYVWISPSLPPSVLHTLWVNSPTAGGDYRFTLRSLAALSVEAALFALFVALARRSRQPAHLRFFVFFAVLASAIPILGAFANWNVVPQPHRYQLDMEMAICWAAAFAFQPLADRWPRPARVLAALLLVCLAARQTILYRRFARTLIQPADVAQIFEYQTAHWFDEHFHGRRVMATGAAPCG